MFNLEKIRKDPRQMKALTGMTIEEFEQLVPHFEQILYENAANKKRKRAVGAGRIGKLTNVQAKLFFILFYVKTYPTYDLAAAIFDIHRSRICRWVKNFSSVLEKVLGRTLSLPKRQIRNIEELFEYFPETKDVFIDGVERPTQRPKKPKKQKRQYSGKKKRHTRKNIVMTDEKKRILYLSATKDGKIHDYKQLKKTDVLKRIPRHITIWVDKGFTGITKEVDNNQVQIPHKKPRKGQLSEEQKQDNKLMASVRILVEHAIGGVKRFGCVSQICRNRQGFDDRMMAICSGLWNFHLQIA
jgi:hypothetical protein